MAAGNELKVTAGILAAVAASAAVYQAASVFAPLVLALFIIGIVWPMQNSLQSYMPRLVALAITLVVIVAVCLVFGSLVVWGFSRVDEPLSWMRRVTSCSTIIWWCGWTITASRSLACGPNISMSAGLRAAQRVSGRINTTLTFWLITLTYVILGLLEVDVTRLKIEALGNRDAARVLLGGCAATAVKFRKYMLVRTEMSLTTGLLVGAFAWITGLPFAVEWGVIAFALNYIPFIGPFVATLFPTLLAMTQFDSWQAVLGTFICLNIIQFVVGSYIEPRLSGSVLSISPFLVLFAIFFWTLLWGLFGTFIGVPITLAILTFCGQHPSTRWLADLFGGPAQGLAEG